MTQTAITDDGSTQSSPSPPARPAAAGGAAQGVTRPSGGFTPETFLSEVVIAMGLADPERMETALQAARNPGMMLEGVLTETGVLTEDELARALAERYDVDHIDLGVFRLQAEAAELLSTEFARRYAVLPVAFAAAETLLVAMADPGDWIATEEISRLTGYDIRRASAARSALLALAEHVCTKGPVKRRPPSPAVAATALAGALEAESHTPPAPTVTERDAIVATAPATPSSHSAPIAGPDEPPASVVDAGFEAFQRWMLETWVAEREHRLEAERDELDRERDQLERERVALQRQSAALNRTIAA